MRLTHFGGVALPTPQENIDWQAEGRTSLFVLRDGSFDEDGVDSVLQPYTLSRSFRVISSIDTTIDNLAELVGVGRRVLKSLQRDGTTYRQTLAKITRFARPLEVAMKNHQDAQITWQIDYPYWMLTADEPYYLNHGDVLDTTPDWVLDGQYTTQALTTASHTVTITNDGKAVIRNGLIEVRPRAGASITNIKILNKTNWMSVEYNGVLGALSWLAIDLLPKSCKVDAIDKYSKLKIGAEQMDWMQLEVGANTLIVSCFAITGTVDFYYHWSATYI